MSKTSSIQAKPSVSQASPVASVARRLAQRILDGDWPAGQKLPSVRTLAREQGVSLNSMQGALRQLEGRGLIDSLPRRGNYVKSPAAVTGRPTQARQIGFVRYHTPGSADNAPATLAERDAWGQYILRGVEDTLAGSDYNLTLLCSIGQADWARQTLGRINQMRHQLAGVVLYAMPGVELLTDELDRQAMPWVTINRQAMHQTHNFVHTDYIDAGLAVGRLFAAMGVRKAVFLTVDMAHSVSSLERAMGIMQARLQAHQPTPELHTIDCDDWFEASAYRAMQAHLASHEPPQAVFSTGDFLAIGAMRACQDHGLRVPEDVSIVGGSGLDMARYTQPTLSLIQQPMAQIGQPAARMLLSMIQQGRNRMPGQLLPGRLILRGSTRVTPRQAQAASTPRTTCEFE